MVVVQKFNPSNQEAETSRALSSRLAWSTEFQENQGYTKKPYLKNQNQTKPTIKKKEEQWAQTKPEFLGTAKHLSKCLQSPLPHQVWSFPCFLPRFPRNVEVLSSSQACWAFLPSCPAEGMHGLWSRAADFLMGLTFVLSVYTPKYLPQTAYSFLVTDSAYPCTDCFYVPKPGYECRIISSF